MPGSVTQKEISTVVADLGRLDVDKAAGPSVWVGSSARQPFILHSSGSPALQVACVAQVFERKGRKEPLSQDLRPVPGQAVLGAAVASEGNPSRCS